MPRPASQPRHHGPRAPLSAAWAQNATRGPQIPEKWITPLIGIAGASGPVAAWSLADPWYCLAGLIAVYAFYATDWTPPTTKDTAAK